MNDSTQVIEIQGSRKCYAGDAAQESPPEMPAPSYDFARHTLQLGSTSQAIDYPSTSWALWSWRADLPTCVTLAALWLPQVLGDVGCVPASMASDVACSSPVSLVLSRLVAAHQADTDDPADAIKRASPCRRQS